MINTLHRETQALPMVQRSSRKRKQPVTYPEKTTLHNALNVRALDQLARRCAAGAWRPNGSGPTLRKIRSDFLAQVREGYFPSIWREEDRMRILGLEGRRYSG